MTDWEGLAAAKYALLGQHAAADTMRAQSEAAYRGALMGQMGPQNARDNALNRANIAHLGAQSGMLGAQTAGQQQLNAAGASTGHNRPLDPLASSGGGLGTAGFGLGGPSYTPPPGYDGGATGGAMGSPAGMAPRPSPFNIDVGTPNIDHAANGDWARTNAASANAGVKSVQPPAGSITPDDGVKDNYGRPKGMQISGLKRGTARVPGKGSPKKDTVPAVLAPGEAVLNAPAAQMAGRGNIAALNRQGAGMMGMRPGRGNTPGHYATGVARVTENGSSGRSGDIRAGTSGRGFEPISPTYPPGRGSLGGSPNTQPYPHGGETPQHYAAGSANVMPGDAASNFVRGMLAPAPQPMPQIDRGPAMAAPAPQPWGMPAGGGVPMPPMRPAGLGGPSGELHAPHPDMVPSALPASPQPWAMPQPGGVPMPPMRPPGLGGYASPAPGMENPQGHSIAQFEAGMAQRAAPRPDLGAERARGGSFGEAFAAARRSAGGGKGMFDWNGKSYRTNIRGER